MQARLCEVQEWLHGSSLKLPPAIDEIKRLIQRSDKPIIFNRHVLGFYSAKILESNGFAVRLHYWPAENICPAEPDWPIHTHQWDITSVVVAGVVENTQYTIDESGDDWLIYRVEYQSEGSARIATGRFVSVANSVSDKIEAGQQYTVPFGAFHSSRIGKDSSLTLMRTGKPQSQPPLVLGEKDGSPRYDYKVTVPSETEQGRIRGAVLELLQDSIS